MERVKNIYFIDVKIKGQYKRLVSLNLICNANYVSFKGVEVGETYAVNSNDEAKEALNLFKNQVERYYPWTNVEEIIVKRYTV